MVDGMLGRGRGFDEGPRNHVVHFESPRILIDPSSEHLVAMRVGAIAPPPKGVQDPAAVARLDVGEQTPAADGLQPPLARQVCLRGQMLRSMREDVVACDDLSIQRPVDDSSMDSELSSYLSHRSEPGLVPGARVTRDDGNASGDPHLLAHFKVVRGSLEPVSLLCELLQVGPFVPTTGLHGDDVVAIHHLLDGAPEG